MATTNSTQKPPSRPCFVMKPTVNPSTDESDPLLAHYTRFSHQQQNGALEQQYDDSTDQKPPWTDHAKRYLNEDLDTQYTDFILLFCFLLTGIIDAGAYNAYQVFVSMVTGNTIFVALSISSLPIDVPSYAWTKSLTSIASFIAGTILFSAFHRHYGAKKRWTLLLTFSIQATLIFVSASLIAGRSSSESPAKPPASLTAPEAFPADPGFPWSDLLPICLLSLQASAKILSSRWLQHPHLTTCVLTVLYSDLFSDAGLWTAGLFSDKKRNQRFAGAVVYFVGATVGGGFARSRVGFEGALWVVGGCNLIIVAAWGAWWAVERREEEDGE